jgi:hypothetical protein
MLNSWPYVALPRNSISLAPDKEGRFNVDRLPCPAEAMISNESI